MRLTRLVIPAFLAFAAGGCSIALDEGSGPFSAAPGKYDFLDCPGIAERTKQADTREAELNNLIERANREPSGVVVSALVYRDELTQVRSNQYALRKAADDKRCAPDIKPQNTSLSPMH
jgi:hypothetical protein